MISSYNDGSEKLKAARGGDDYIRISPSQASLFFEKTHQFYAEQVRKEPKLFTGNTGTVLGNVIHEYMDRVINNKSIDEMTEEVDSYLSSISDPLIDKVAVRTLWLPMAKELAQENITNTKREVVDTEQFIYKEIIPNSGIYPSGSYDLMCVDPLTGGVRIVDYKTADKKPSGIKASYKLQQQIYCWILKENGHNVTSYELAFVVRPTKTLPVRAFNFVEPYTSETHDYIGSILMLMGESIEAYIKHPELQHIICQDMRVKGSAKVAFPL